MGRGHVLQALKRLDEAIADFDRAILLERAGWRRHTTTAPVALQDLKRVDEALASYDSAIELSAGRR